MAPVAGHPFLTYVIRHLLSQGIEKFIFSLGYRHETSEKFLETEFYYIDYECVIEETPLGTGGAIQFALKMTTDRNVLIVNGDTLFKVDVDELHDRHVEHQADCTIALKPMENFDRYGSVILNDESRIQKFEEKKFTKHGLINGGVYLLNSVSFSEIHFPKIFSFEKDYLESKTDDLFFTGVIQDDYFIDIGIPEDFTRAQMELRKKPIPFDQIDASWTLFLDRDGVINFNKDDSYVFHRGEFKFIPGAIEAIRKLSGVFGKIFIVTNQRGIGKGLMDIEALHDIHEHMIEEITQGGGRIDGLYYCPALDDKNPERKPNPGMLLEAAHMFPEIEFSKSIVVGDKMSDMLLGRNVGAFTVMVDPMGKISAEEHPDIDLMVGSLAKFEQNISSSTPG